MDGILPPSALCVMCITSRHMVLSIVEWEDMHISMMLFLLLKAFLGQDIGRSYRSGLAVPVCFLVVLCVLNTGLGFPVSGSVVSVLCHFMASLAVAGIFSTAPYGIWVLLPYHLSALQADGSRTAE